MISSVFLLLALGQPGKNQNSASYNQNCEIVRKLGLSVKNAKENLVGGLWVYQYSFAQDTCFKLANNYQIPYSIRYFRCDDGRGLKKRMPQVYKQRENNFFEKLCAETFASDDEKIEQLFPILINSDTIDGDYLYINNYGEKNKFTCAVLALRNDSLVMSDDIKYRVGATNFTKVRHLYLRQSKF